MEQVHPRMSLDKALKLSRRLSSGATRCNYGEGAFEDMAFPIGWGSFDNIVKRLRVHFQRPLL